MTALTAIDQKKLFTYVCIFYLFRNHQYINIIKVIINQSIKLLLVSIFYPFLFPKLKAAPIPMPAAIHSGSPVAANSPAPIATPTAISVPVFQEDLVFLLIIHPNIKHYSS